MNGYEWFNYLKERRPEYALSRVALIERFANKGKSKSDYVQFGPIYQLFMYATMLGFHRNERIPLPSTPSERTEFIAIYRWQPEGLVNYLLMLLMADKSIQEEIGLDFMAMEDDEEAIIKDKFKHLVRIMEEYANGGLGILGDRFETNPDFFSDPFAFPSLLKEIADGNLIQSK